MKVTVGTAIASLVLVSSLAGPALAQDDASAAPKDKYVIGMSQANKGEPWRQAMNDQIQAAADLYPEIEVVFADAAQNNAKQVADVENFIQQGIDLLIDLAERSGPADRRREEGQRPRHPQYPARPSRPG